MHCPCGVVHSMLYCAAGTEMMTTHDDHLANNKTNLNNALSFPKFILYNFFSFMVVLGMGFYVGFLG